MYILFEEHPYSIDHLDNLGLHDFAQPVGPHAAKLTSVGFYRTGTTCPPIFVLPKIILHNDTLFGEYTPTQLATAVAKHVLDPGELQVVKDIAERLYFSLRRIQSEEMCSPVSGTSNYSIRSTFGPSATSSFEAMLSLIQFNKANPTLFVQEREMRESVRPRLFNWKKTFASTTPVHLRGEWLYLDLIGIAQHQRRDDPILIIYYSLLNEFKQFDPSIQIDPSVVTLSSAAFARLRRRAPLLLKNSRTHYFSDTFKRLHALLEKYFSSENASFGAPNVEYLVSDAFQVVFERFVDSLLSDESLLAEFKELKDGKEIDHLFGEADVFGGNKIIYIGDSKYYKDPTKIHDQRYKQFTYARNIIQENIDIVNRGGETLYSRNYRDPVSEGYNVSPNFFVFGTVESNCLESPELLQPDNQSPEFSCHFPNRLFDRDTLHILYFRVDLIGLLAFYAKTERRFPITAQKLRAKARALVRATTASYLNGRYHLYSALIPQQILETNFKSLLGKVFSSPATRPRSIVALERGFDPENSTVLRLLRSLHVDLASLALNDSLNGI